MSLSLSVDFCSTEKVFWRLGLGIEGGLVGKVSEEVYAIMILGISFYLHPFLVFPES